MVATARPTTSHSRRLRRACPCAACKGEPGYRGRFSRTPSLHPGEDELADISLGRRVRSQRRVGGRPQHRASTRINGSASSAACQRRVRRDASELLQSGRRRASLTLTLNRPDVLNAITPPLLDELTAALNEAAGGRSVRAVIITGAGRGFCSGQDLRAASGDSGLDVGAILRDHYAPAIRVIRRWISR